MKSYSHQFKPIAALIGCANCKSVMRRERERERDKQTDRDETEREGDSRAEPTSSAT